MSGVKIDIQGLQEAQQGNQRTIAALQPSGAMGRAVQQMTLDAQRYAISITHVDTGSLRASHRVSMNGNRGMVYLDETAVNPRSRAHPAVYGPAEHNRGYPHNFYERTVEERGKEISQDALNQVYSALP